MASAAGEYAAGLSGRNRRVAHAFMPPLYSWPPRIQLRHMVDLPCLWRVVLGESVMITLRHLLISWRIFYCEFTGGHEPDPMCFRCRRCGVTQYEKCNLPEWLV